MGINRLHTPAPTTYALTSSISKKNDCHKLDNLPETEKKINMSKSQYLESEIK